MFFSDLFFLLGIFESFTWIFYHVREAKATGYGMGACPRSAQLFHQGEEPGVAAERIEAVSEDVSGGEVHGLFSLSFKRKYPRRPTAVNKN
jgi:hypothetical protein